MASLRPWLGSVALASLAPAGGCSSQVFAPSSPTLSALEAGEVHVTKARGTADQDFYKITYIANVPVEVAWETAMEMPEWLQDNRMVHDIRRLAPGGGAGASAADADGRHYLVRWKDETVQELVVRRDEARKLIDISVPPDSRADRQWGHCTVMIGPFRRNSAIVEAEVRVSTSFGNTLASLLLTPANLLTGGSVETRVRKLWQDLAVAHRRASELALELRPPATGRTHVIAVGVESFDRPGAWSPLAYAREDAEAFFSWATKANPVLPDQEGTLIRALLVGSEATSVRLGEVLQRLNDPRGVQAVRPGDTILFFFAGHIELEEDVLAARGRRGDASYPYLVTANADPENLRFTAIKREDVLDALRYSDAAQCVLFCDACYSGGPRVGSVDALSSGLVTRGRTAPDPGFQRLGRNKGADGEAGLNKTGILAAARPLGLAAESDELKHGLFTYALLEGAGGEADFNDDGYVTLRELADHVEKSVARLSDGRQTPYASFPPTGNLDDLRWAVDYDSDDG